MPPYSFSGNIQYATVGNSGEYILVASGAQGGGSPRVGAVGGYGASVSGDFFLSQGEILKIVIGGEGGASVGYGAGAGGGGGTFIYGEAAGASSFTLLEVAGGGGGAGNVLASNGVSYGSGNVNGGYGQATTSGGTPPNSGAGGTSGAYGASDSSGGGAGVRGPAQGYAGYGATAGSNGSNGFAGGLAANNGNSGGGASGEGGFGGGGGGSYVERPVTVGMNGFTHNQNGYDGLGGGGGGYSGGGGGGLPAAYGATYGQGGGGGGSFVSAVAMNPTEDGNAHGGNGAFSFVHQNPVCFAAGTRILTDDGEVPVETLAVGDLVKTASGALRPIKWLGHRSVNIARHADPETVLPIRIAAHALGDNRPSRDLLLSPAHAVAVNIFDEVLVPAGALVNGSTIAQVEASHITYWHVELDSHDLLLAENLATESYIDMGNRRFFVESEVIDLAAQMETPAERRTDVDYCRPFVHSGPAVVALAALTGERALRMGWRLAGDAYGDMHLIVDGERIAPKVDGLLARFDMPSGARNVWLASTAARPLDVGVSRDPRRLGLSLLGLEIDDGLVERKIAIDDARLSQGFHAYEGWHRWTDGRARLPAEMFTNLAERCMLTVQLAAPALARWMHSPVAAPARFVA